MYPFIINEIFEQITPETLKIFKKKPENKYVILNSVYTIMTFFMSDSFLYKINKLESSVNDINLHLEKHHAEFKNGVIISICGIGSTVAGVVLIYKGMTSTTRTRHNFNSTTNTTTNNKSGRGSSSASTGIGVTFTSLGAIMTGIGCVIMIDSDKWFSQKRSHIY